MEVDESKMSIFIEKYRPKIREELVGNKDAIDRIFEIVKTGNLPHMIFEGPAGTGKTTTAHIIARQLFGEYYKSNFEELNASDSRRIEDVRTTIKMFAKTSPLPPNKFKILLLDEAEMTDEAQQALRRLMERYSDITKFILTVNNLSDIIDPIQSRCAIFRFGPLAAEDMYTRLHDIYNKETGLSVVAEAQAGLMKIAELAHGDMRRAINHLQVLLANNKPITAEAAESFRPVDYGKIIYDSIASGRLLEARKAMQKALELGYTERHLLDLLHKVYIDESTLDISIKAKAVFALAETDYRLTLGVDRLLAMDSMLYKLMEIHH